MDVRVYTINQLRTNHGYNSHFFLTPNVFQLYLHLTNIKNSFNQERLTTEYTARQSRLPAISLAGNQNHSRQVHRIITINKSQNLIPNDHNIGFIISELWSLKTLPKNKVIHICGTARPAFIVDIGADVSFKAGNIITLKPGFSASE